MRSATECEALPERAIGYVERTVSTAERETIEKHLQKCPACREALRQVRAVFAALEYAELETPVSVDTGAHTATPAGDSGGTWKTRLSSAPWWLVSGALHFLVIALASLVTLAIERPPTDDAVIMMTELQQKPWRVREPEQPSAEPTDILAQTATGEVDAGTAPASEVVVLPEILARSALGDHFETINPELPDTHGALGDAEGKSFHALSGNPDRAGGGGMGGTGMEDLIGSGGGGSRGSGSGFGSGDGSGMGTGRGSGTGAFGQRNGGGRKLLVRKHGGSLATENAVDRALEWLAYHQDPDGHWEIGKYEGYEPMSCGVTGIAVLAFLGAGHSERAGKYRDNVKRAIAWIISKQGADGSIGEGFKENTADFGHEGHAYHHAICGLALAEAAGMAHQKATIEAAQKAVDYSTLKHQGGEGSDKTAWRYTPKKDADASVSGWFVMQLKSAKIAGLHVDPAGFEGALKFYDSVEDKREVNGYSGGRFCYTKAEGVQLNPSAIGILCNLFLGRQPSDLTGGAELLNQNLPKWDKELGDGVEHLKFPMYYSYYGTLTMFQMGGEYWKNWNTALKAMLLPQQRKDGDFTGSWDPLGGYDDHCGGRVYMTAMSALCLEVYYRYARL